MKERALTALSMLCQVFSKYPKSLCYIRMSWQLTASMPWMSIEGQERTLTIFQLSIFLDAVDRILLLQSFLPGETRAITNTYADPSSREEFMNTETLFFNFKTSMVVF